MSYVVVVQHGRYLKVKRTGTSILNIDAVHVNYVKEASKYPSLVRAKQAANMYLGPFEQYTIRKV